MEEIVFIESKFHLGEIVSTIHLFEHCEKNRFALFLYLVRHANGDWAMYARKTGIAMMRPLKTA